MRLENVDNECVIINVFYPFALCLPSGRQNNEEIPASSRYKTNAIID